MVAQGHGLQGKTGRGLRCRHSDLGEILGVVFRVEDNCHFELHFFLGGFYIFQLGVGHQLLGLVDKSLGSCGYQCTGKPVTRTQVYIIYIYTRPYAHATQKELRVEPNLEASSESIIRPILDVCVCVRVCCLAN